jgi:hypothetical protein
MSFCSIILFDFDGSTLVALTLIELLVKMLKFSYQKNFFQSAKKWESISMFRNILFSKWNLKY